MHQPIRQGNLLKACPGIGPAKPFDHSFHRDNQLGADGWTAVADAMEGVTSLTSLNGCDTWRAIRGGGQTEIMLGWTELGVWVGRYLERSAKTLITLDLR